MKLNRSQWIGVFVALVIVGFFLYGGNIISFFNNKTSNKPMNTATSSGDQNSAGRLVIRDSQVGTGEEAVAGSLVTLNYVGSLSDGTVFDASSKHGAPFQFTLGVGQVISGWDIGILGMKVGGKRHLVIPSSLAYGNQAIGSIPANSALIFDVELLSVKPGAAIDNVEGSAVQ